MYLWGKVGLKRSQYRRRSIGFRSMYLLRNIWIRSMYLLGKVRLERSQYRRRSIGFRSMYQLLNI